MTDNTRKSATAELITTYGLDRMKQIATTGLEEFLAGSDMQQELKGALGNPVCGAKLYRITYHSAIPEHDSKPTIASGLVAIPDTGAKTMPVLSYQHGTVFDRHQVPSFPDRSPETQMVLGRFASQGYIVIGADYFGRGISELPDSYLVKDSSHQANFDFLVAALGFIKAQGIETGPLFLSGWSQGGWTTMQYLRLLEARRVAVKAAAVASAPVDVFLTMNRWMSNWQKKDATYLPGAAVLQLLAQEYYCRQPGLAEAAIRPEYLAACRALYNGEIDFATFYERTPPKLVDLINTEFRESGFLGHTHYWQTMQDSQAWRWRANTPTRTYYGGSDEVTPDIVAHLWGQAQELLGGTEAKTLFAGEMAMHRDIFIYGLPDQKAWFDDLLKG